MELKEIAEKLVCPLCGAKPDHIQILDGPTRDRIIFQCPEEHKHCPIEEVVVEF